MATYNVCSWGKVNCSGSKLKPIGRLACLLFKDGQRIVYHLLWSKIKSGSSDILVQVALWLSKISGLKSFIFTKE